ncbi:MAG TPA: hypothetical protein PKY50_04565 [Candidatus Competibacter sp.]|nr:hypothetical protein [Candidatus Competibacter sp.]
MPASVNDGCPRPCAQAANRSGSSAARASVRASKKSAAFCAWLAAAGWDIEYLDLDLTGTNPVADIRLAREDGRSLLARVDALGRCAVETFHREIGLGVPVNRRGRHARFPLVEDVFLGRTRHQGPRAMLRHLTSAPRSSCFKKICGAASNAARTA